MLKQLQPYYVTDIQNFSTLTSSYLSGPCGLSQDATYAWISRGPVLEVFDTHKNEKHSFWKFQNNIVAVEEFVEPFGQKLVIGLSESNVVCLYDAKCSKVLKAVTLPYEIRSLNVVAHEGGACVETRFLSPLLRYMFGVVAVGTRTGYVLLLDLCLDEPSLSDEFLTGEVLFVAKDDDKIANKREDAVSSGRHLCLVLNENKVLRGQFIDRFGEKEIHINSEEAVVTCVKYISSLSILALGFSFGGVQLWKLQEHSVLFSWIPETLLSPIVKFAFQEPENDPRNYCYLWVVSGQDVNSTVSAELKTVATMYSIACGRKDWIEGFGSVYQDLQTCTYRFDCILTSDANGNNKTAGSRIISCSCVHPAAVLTSCKTDELAADDWLNEDLSLCVLVWEAWEENLSSTCHMAIFDINQWYQAQMPSNVRGEWSSFFGLFSLEEVIDKLEENDHIMDVCIYPSSLAKFFSLSSSEEFYYPSSLAFRAFCLTTKGTFKISYLGSQRQVFWLMEKRGLQCLLEPGELYESAVSAGLVEASSSLVKQQEELLNMAVENRLLAFLAGCILNLRGHEQMGGISLKNMLDWSWKKVTQIKMSVDKLCEPLFNCSGHDLDQQSLSLLHSYLSQLKILSRVFELLCTSSSPVTEQGEQEIQTRQEVTHLLGMFLKVVLWLHQCSLLPEHEEGDAYGENEVAYPTNMLAEMYAQRRREIRQLHSTVSQTDLLLIDAIVAEMGLTNQWEKVSGGSLYPPPSLHAALSSYFQYGVAVEDKHCFLLYLLLDLASFLSDKQSHVEEKLMHFPASFDLCPSRVKLTQGFWMLDHKDFQEALVNLLDPIIKPLDIQPWQHVRIIKSFLYQGEHKKALQYAQVRKPLLQTPEEVKLHLTLLLANRLTAEAFHYQRQCRDQLSMDDMLTHFFLGCHQTGNMDALLQLPFSSAEEEALIHFLLTNSEFRSQELVIGYFLQHGRPLEAAHLNLKLKPDIMEYSSDREHPGIRNSLLSSYLKTLPFAQKKLDEHVRGFKSKAVPQRKEVVQPVPLSSCIRSVSLRHTSLSSLIRHVEDKVKMTCGENSPFDQESTTPDNTPCYGAQIFQRVSGQREVDVLATPVTKRPLTPHSDLSWTPNKKSRLLDYSPSKWSNAEKRRNTPIVELLSVMQTPPVKRSQPTPRGTSTEAVSSILKNRPIRHAITSKLSPVDTSYGKELRFSVSPNRNLTPRKSLRSSFSTAAPEEIVDDGIVLNYSKVLPHLSEEERERFLFLRTEKPREETPEPVAYLENKGDDLKEKSKDLSGYEHDAAKAVVVEKDLSEKSLDASPSDDRHSLSEISLKDELVEDVESSSSSLSHKSKLHTLQMSKDGGFIMHPLDSNRTSSPIHRGEERTTTDSKDIDFISSQSSYSGPQVKDKEEDTFFETETVTESPALPQIISTKEREEIEKSSKEFFKSEKPITDRLHKQVTVHEDKNTETSGVFLEERSALEMEETPNEIDSSVFTSVDSSASVVVVISQMCDEVQNASESTFDTAPCSVEASHAEVEVLIPGIPTPHASTAVPSSSTMLPQSNVGSTPSESHIALAKEKHLRSGSSLSTHKMSLRQRVSSEKMDDSRTSGEESFVSLEIEASLLDPCKESDNFETSKETDEMSIISTVADSAKQEEGEHAKSTRHHMKLRSESSSDAEVTLSPVRQRSGRRAKAQSVSPVSTESESLSSSSRPSSRTSAKRTLLKKKIVPTTIPEFSEPEFPTEEVIHAPETPGASVPTFFFSPPLTRSRVRRKKSQERETSTSSTHDLSSVKEEGIKKSRRKSIATHSDWEETVVLISPIVKKASGISMSRQTSQRSQRTLTARGRGSRTRQSAKL